jgi:uncharacterized protein YkwD
MSLCLFVLAAMSLMQAPSPDAPDSSTLKISAKEQRILDLTNAARAKEGLTPLKPNATLFEVARAHSANMAKQHKMEHVLDGQTPADRVKTAGYRYRWMGENIAYGKYTPIDKIFDEWMNSKHHRENILKPEYREIGIGIARGSDDFIYYSQVFGTRLRR